MWSKSTYMKSLLLLFLSLISFGVFAQRLECEAVGVQVGYYDSSGIKKWTSMIHSTSTIILTNDCMDVVGVYDKHFEIKEQVKNVISESWILDGWSAKDQDGKKCIVEVLYYKHNQETNIIIDYGNVSWLYKIGGCK
jgi:hypothetical protein